MLFFFFKQKTAYEMRISDWSSDVCSSDLHRHSQCPRCEWPHRAGIGIPAARAVPAARRRRGLPRDRLPAVRRRQHQRCDRGLWQGDATATPRSEEHTSELQSLMRISYAVFCLKKKNTKDKPPHKESTQQKYN